MSLCAVLGVSALPPTLDYTPVLRALRKPPDTVAVMVRLLQRDDAPLSDTELREYSEQLRLAGASAIVLKGDARALDVLLEEQAGSAGEYPGPCPVLFEAAGSSGVAGCRAQALVARSGTVAAGAAEASSLPLVPLAATAAELQEALATPSPLILSSAAAWAELPAPGASDGARADAAAGEAEGSRGEAGSGERARELRGAGCAGVVIDFDPRSSLCGPEGVLRPLLSKRSSAFGSLGLSLGMGMSATVASDSYWITKQMKEAKASQRRAALSSGKPPSGFGES
ncbi:hypothetical protein EMIHUDRAFT_206989 [Emiliania huxleyi CCMP1516]|uniref:Uncharacterized protein n=2 Tax=Emiliania huxleyi TaxID=2903 RepID=A0A0D3ISP7_EMIH1|nr:hypothetical protein EMIHUDRAFT_119580 [Emiliania huxleyi CCMP1516]XP_005776408.1 hypothetical protein EMIHUDRAFT_206989 [Emiliania huxleyi CCMP1516]EOD14282.1 hypothetical protein EMIHUDRAFT_119580 [Emiliania huxleyi CCMP1516]EOD23979.1 hypothetical protein EMIHUDRAFT_206989 [Emiliania huxleyi CCMP1516]|eukprot:XP_005766711.1 hypothetical protein EMIHUDRAFT_119580 [Emiliania huxleyi CCMP1516]